jgi:uncharacterized repeat protein (TIGR03806 family)
MASHWSGVAIAVLLLVEACGAAPTDPGPGHDGGPRPDAGLSTDAAKVGLTTRIGNPSCRPPASVPESGTAGLPPTLAETGCFDPVDPTRPLPGLIPYDVKAPLWSDGASKERWLALPDGAQIHVEADGDFTLPPGTVTIKTFSLAGRRVETRFFVRLASGDWAGYTYQWNDAGTDAVVLHEGSQERAVGDQKHYYPTRAECLKCHEKAAGSSLGLELAQLDGDLSYPGGRRANQLVTWQHIGLFDAPLPAVMGGIASLPAPGDGAAPLETRARAYLHANCANCHRPGGDGSGSIDLRFSVPLAETMACDAEAIRGTLEAGPDARIITPGVPEKSILVVRMMDLGRGRMPEFGSLRIDDEGTSLVADWVRSLKRCP